MWGWLKPLLDWLSSLVIDRAEKPTASTDAKTTDETRKAFQDQLGGRLRRPPGPPAD